MITLWFIVYKWIITFNYRIIPYSIRYSPTVEKYEMKGMFKIVLITDKECEYLLSKGWKWRNHIHRTVSGANKKYATENYRLMQDLEKFRSRSIKETTHTNKRKNRKRKK